MAKAQTPARQQFDFLWEGCAFTALVLPLDDGTSDILLKGAVGRLYFTIEDADKRQTGLSRLRRLNRAIDGSYRISSNGDIQFESITSAPGALIGDDLLSAVTLVVLEAEAHMKEVRDLLKPVPLPDTLNSAA